MLLDIPNIPDIPEGWKYLAGSLAGGGIAMIITILNNCHQLEKDSEQWEREKLWNGYQKCTSSLVLMESLWTDILSPKKMEIWSALKESRVNCYKGFVPSSKAEERMKELKEIREAVKEIQERIKEIEEQIKEMVEQILSIYSEMYPYLYWIIYNYPDPRLQEITILKESIEQKQITEINIQFIDERKLALIPPISAVQSMRQELIQLMANDPRLLKK